MSGARAHAPPWGLEFCVFAGALWRNSVCLEVGAPFLAGCFSIHWRGLPGPLLRQVQPFKFPG